MSMILSSSLSVLVGLLALLAVMAYAWPAISQSMTEKRVALSLTLAWLLHAAILLITLFSGRFGFGPALSVMAWLVLSVYGIESYLYPRMQSRRVLAALGGAALVLGLVFPGAALDAKSSMWLPLHGALGVASYGLLAVAAVHAWLMHRADEHMRTATANITTDQGLPLMTIERLMMAFSMTAFVLLSCTLAAGWFFGNELYGSEKSWLWNHKTIFSILAWVAMATLLMGRWLRGWRGKQAARLVYGSAVLLLLSYVGSRFVLEVLLQRFQ
jgi:ABC-type uncharacterized transport system permease subunit